MTFEDFNAVRPRLARLADSTIQMAFEVLVQGDSQSKVAARHKFSKQRVHLAVNRVLAEVEGVPASWQKVEVWVPAEVAVQIKEMELEARRMNDLKDTKKS